MENKQTAVEWLIENMPDISNYISVGISLELHAKFQQAIAMEREQIETAYKSDRRPCSDEDAQEYYNDTYGTQRSH